MRRHAAACKWRKHEHYHPVYSLTCGKWQSIVDFPMKMVIFHNQVKLPQGIVLSALCWGNRTETHGVGELPSPPTPMTQIHAAGENRFVLTQLKC